MEGAGGHEWADGQYYANGYTNELIGGWLKGGIDLQMDERMNGRTPSV